MKRRDLLGVAAVAASGHVAAQAAASRLQVWRDPGCGCCGGWVEHMRRAGFAIDDGSVGTPVAARRRLGTPADLLSCHVAEVAGLALEGHVPAAAVLRVLAERPAGVRGLAVPGMPVGSPGMEVPGQAEETYDVIAFDASRGRRVFMRFRGGVPVRAG